MLHRHVRYSRIYGAHPVLHYSASNVVTRLKHNFNFFLDLYVGDDTVGSVFYSSCFDVSLVPLQSWHIALLVVGVLAWLVTIAVILAGMLVACGCELLFCIHVVLLLGLFQRVLRPLG